jgi:hypothetical protein
VTDDPDATVNAGDGGIAGTVVFASLQRLEVWFNLFGIFPIKFTDINSFAKYESWL